MDAPNHSSEQEPAEVTLQQWNSNHQLNSESRQRRLERYQRVCDLARQGFSIRAIGLQTGLDRKTIRRFLRAGEFPERASPKRRPTKIGPYQSYLRRRFEEQKMHGETPGVRCGQQLFDEICARGYRGGLTMLKEYLHRLRHEAGMILLTSRNQNTPSSSPKQKPLSPRAVTWLLLKPAEELKPNEQQHVDRLCEQSPTINQARDLIIRFFDLVRTRSADELLPWLSQAEACGIASLRQFAIGLRRDLKAVIPALTLEWSNGQVEGFVNKIKFIKRSMYGRANFDLLKAKVIVSGAD